MNRIKRQWNSTVDSYNNEGDDRKVQRTSLGLRTTDNANRNSITHFEDLSNDVIYEIFEFLDGHHIYDGFFRLNTRFQNLCIYLTIPINIRISSVSKSTFQHYYTHFIVPHKHQIQSIHLSDPFTIDFLFSSTQDISKYSQLQTLILDKIESLQMENLLIDLSSLLNLSSLSIFISRESEKNMLYNLIFQLPVLKYCKITFEANVYLGSLPVSTNGSSSIEHLVIKGDCEHVGISTLLSYVPQVRRLSIDYISESYKQEKNIFNMILNNLTHIYLTLSRVNFAELERFIKNHCRQIEVFHISTIDGQGYLDFNEWERLISSYIPHVRIFNFEFRDRTLYYENGEITSEILLNQFKSSFWSGRKCYFAYHRIDMKYKNRGVFYSKQPYKKDYFILSNGSDLTDSCYHGNIFHSTRHLYIDGGNVLNKCQYYFPNVTKLEIDGQHFEYSKLFSTTLNRFVSLTQLTELIITAKYCYFKALVDILKFTTNLRKLILQSLLLGIPSLDFLQRNQTFQLILRQNNIEYIHIKYGCTLNIIKLFINLCPRLQSLTIGTSLEPLEPIVRFLLSKNDQITCQLFSLCIFAANFDRIEKLKRLIRSIQLTNDYSIKVINCDLYIWW